MASHVTHLLLVRYIAMRPSMAVHRCAAGSPARTIAPHQRHPTRIAAAPPKALQITPREREAYHSLQQGGILAPGETPTQGASRLIERAATAKDVPNDHVIAAMATMELEQATQGAIMPCPKTRAL